MGLKNRSFIKDYLIENQVMTTDVTIVYLVEDMRKNKKYYLTEFFPQKIALRKASDSEDTDQKLETVDESLFQRYKKIFLEEIEKFQQYEHKDLMKISHTFEDNNTVYVVSEYQEEIPFKEFLKQKKLTEFEITKMMHPLFSILISLHSKGIIFRHLNASNIMIRRDGSALLCHFHSSSPATYKGYSPIEQYSAMKDSVTAQSDIFALGALFYESVNGYAPVDAKEREIMLEKNLKDPFEPIEFDGYYSEDFCRGINKSLAADMKERPPSIVSFQIQVGQQESPQKEEQIVETKEIEQNISKTSVMRFVKIALFLFMAYVVIIMVSPEIKVASSTTQFDILRYKWAGYWGDKQAQRALAYLYKSGIGVEKDEKQAILWHEKAAAQGDIDSILYLENLGIDKTTKQPINKKLKEGKKEAFRRYYKEAQEGNAKSQYKLGWAYYKGLGVSKNQELASYYMDKAAKQAYMSGQIAMAGRYYKGTGIEKDYVKSYNLHKILAEKAYVKSMSFLGYMYWKGIGTQKDLEKSFVWYSKAAEKGNAYSMRHTARCYERGSGVEADIEKALYWYELAANNNQRRAMTRLGELYYYGKKVKKDYTKSRYWLKKAEKLKDPVAETYLARIKKNERQEKKRQEKKIKTQKNKEKKIKKNKEKKLKYISEKNKTIAYEKTRHKTRDPNHRFLDRGEYIQDSVTGLLWQKDGRSSGRINFYQAKEYAQKLSLGGFGGWRVPTRKELAGIFPAHEKPFTNTPYTIHPYREGGAYEWRSYWTSERDYKSKDYAYVFSWYGKKSSGNNCYASKNFEYVRAVHDPIR